MSAQKVTGIYIREKDEDNASLSEVRNVALIWPARLSHSLSPSETMSHKEI